MITILHGEDTLSSQNKLIEFKQRPGIYEKIILDGRKTTLTDLKLALETQSLFSTDRLVVIENLLSSKKSKDKEILINYLSGGRYEPEIVLWEDREITAPTLRAFKSARIYNLKPAANIFKFVDNLRPGAGPQLLLFFHELVKSEVPEVVFVMIARQIRNLLLVKDNAPDFLSTLAPWQRAKLERQVNLFTEEQLIKAQRKLLDIDYKLKTSQTPFDVVALLDIFLVNL